MKIASALVLASALLTASCQSHTTPAATTTTDISPVSSSATAPANSPERQEVLGRFTQYIWPAVVNYHMHNPTQLGTATIATPIAEVIDKDNLDERGQATLRHAADALGTPSVDQSQVADPRSEDFHLADVRVTEFSPPNATLQVCYTYTMFTFPSDTAPLQKQPAASEATFVLHKTAAWYLHAITNDHVVPNCTGSNAA